MLKVARTLYCCPGSPPGAEEAYCHMSVYMRSLPVGASEANTAELELMLRRYITAGAASTDMQAMLRHKAIAEKLAAPACSCLLQRQLEQLAASEGQQEQLPTVEHLQYNCWSIALPFACQLSQPSAGQLATLKAVAASSAQAMRQLEPSNPHSHVAAAEALQVDCHRQQTQQRVEFYLRAFELAQQQRSDYWTAVGAVNAFFVATFCPLEDGHSALAAAVAAFEQAAEAALRRCKRLLPEQWVRPLEYDEQVARCLLPGAHEQLQLWQGQPHGAGPAVSAALQASGDAQAEASSQQVDTSGFDAAHATDCDGCGQAAVGLRRCARCKKAQYCRLGQRCCPHPTQPAFCLVGTGISCQQGVPAWIPA